MKNIITLLLLALFTGSVAAQTGTIYLSVTDPSALESVVTNNDGTVTPVFNNNGINSIISNYSFTVFQQAYPNSRFLSSRQVYLVVANSTNVAADLTTGFPLVFPHYEITAVTDPIGYYPNDFADVLHPGTIGWPIYSWYLDYIYAPDAWNTLIGGNHGDPGVVIGVSDLGFDLTNPDLATKYVACTPCGPSDTADIDHGTRVAGLTAGATDNGVGYPSVGFNCMLDLSTTTNESGMFDLSINRGRKIINASWYNCDGSVNLDIAPRISSQLVFDEIYENGTSTVYAAGNNLTGGGCSGFLPWYFEYPQSLDHIISVTGTIGGEDCIWVGGVSGPHCDYHEITAGDTTSGYQNNTRVDICAPAVRIGSAVFRPLDMTGQTQFTQSDGWGTSFAAPLVSGTLGLMLTANPCLSPYQLEYALEWGSREEVYSVPDNAYLWNTSRWDSRLGAGVLDAGTALLGNLPSGSFIGAANMDCNDPTTQNTFYRRHRTKYNLCAGV